jgi:hypothetical protein
MILAMDFPVCLELHLRLAEFTDFAVVDFAIIFVFDLVFELSAAVDCFEQGLYFLK